MNQVKEYLEQNFKNMIVAAHDEEATKKLAAANLVMIFLFTKNGNRYFGFAGARSGCVRIPPTKYIYYLLTSGGTVRDYLVDRKNFMKENNADWEKKLQYAELEKSFARKYKNSLVLTWTGESYDKESDNISGPLVELVDRKSATHHKTLEVYGKERQPGAMLISADAISDVFLPVFPVKVLKKEQKAEQKEETPYEEGKFFIVEGGLEKARQNWAKQMPAVVYYDTLEKEKGDLLYSKNPREIDQQLGLEFTKFLLENPSNKDSVFDVKRQYADWWLDGKQFEGFDFTEVKLSDCDLTNASFKNCVFDGADFGDTDCQYASFENCSFKGVHFRNTDFSFSTNVVQLQCEKGYFIFHTMEDEIVVEYEQAGRRTTSWFNDFVADNPSSAALAQAAKEQLL